MEVNQSEKRALGKAGEEYACDLLENMGHEILCRNYTARGGEIDIISRCGEYIVFTEVKLRQGRFSPMSAITHKKIDRVIACARHYLAEKGFDLINQAPKVRVDVVALSFDGHSFSLFRHIEGLNLVKTRAKRH